MIITKFGRISADMQVPTAASMQTGQQPGFAEHLEQATAAIDDTAAEPVAGPVAEQVATAPGEPAQALPADAVVADAEPATTAETVASDAGSRPVALVQGDANTVPRGEEPGRQTDAGKGTGSSRTSPFAAIAPQPVTPMPATAAQPTNVAIGGIGAAAANAATGSGRGQAAALRGIELPAGSKTALQRAAAAQAGFRSSSAQSVQLLEQARDSVFKQILFKLGQEGSEMRMRLEPPELGELDLRMVVEKSGQMQLWIAADRPEMVQMLQKNLDQLEQTLRQSGLDITHAEVFAQSGDGRGHQWDQERPDARSSRDDTKAAAAAANTSGSGWITAQGLDFWV